ncbi:MD-2-related lipid-recognition domain [Dillenia turbinata]|uniref:MD-2-related lipid-recognition domain n=1 Tax=Dillenia turbinata TaxID=194707 RepID=A0AAN8ZNQ6_9MAGN
MESIQLKLILSLFVSLCLLAPSTLAVNVDYCDKSASYNVKVQGVEISPNPVARGKPATFSISASTGEAISGGKLVIEVSYFGVHIHTETHDLCSETSCPVLAGDFLIAHSQVLPGFTPPGSYTLTMKMEDENQNLLTCIGFGFQIGFATDVADS